MLDSMIVPIGLDQSMIRGSRRFLVFDYLCWGVRPYEVFLRFSMREMSRYILF